MKTIKFRFTPQALRIRGIYISMNSSTYQVLQHITDRDSTKVVSTSTELPSGEDTYIDFVTAVVEYRVTDDMQMLINECLNIANSHTIHMASEGNLEEAVEKIKARKQEEKEIQKKRQKLYSKNAMVYVADDGTVYHNGEVIVESTRLKYVLNDGFLTPETYYGKPVCKMRYRLVSLIHNRLYRSADLIDDIRTVVVNNISLINDGEFDDGHMKASLAIT